MQDEKIIALYWQRDQSAIDETDKKYGVQLRGLSYGILSDREDAEECVSDTYMAVWNSLPPQRPKRLRAYAAAIVCNLSLRRVRDRYSKKRGGGEVALALEELEDCARSPPMTGVSSCAAIGDLPPSRRSHKNSAARRAK